MPARRPRSFAAPILAFACCALAPQAASADDRAEGAAAARGGPPAIKAPVEGHPVRLFAEPGGGVIGQMADGTVRAIPSGELLLDVREGDKSTTTRLFCAVGEGSAPEEDEDAEAGSTLIACLRSASTSDSSGGGASKELVLLDSEGERSVIAGGSGNGYEVTPLGIHVGPGGKVTYAYAESVPRGDNSVETRQYLVVDGQKKRVELQLGSFVSHLADVGAGDRVDPAIQMVDFKGQLWLVYRSDGAIVAHPPAELPIEVAGASLHDIRPVVGPDGWLYVLYHEPSTSTACAAASRDGKTWSNLTLDTKESGWQMEAAAGPDGVHAVFYYFRNSYNKGLRATTLKDGKQASPTVTIFREDRWNAGWHPHLAIAADGTTWLTYLSNVEEEERVWSRFKSPAALEEHAIGPSAGWEENYKDYFLQTGFGGWLTFWVLSNGVPDPGEVGGVQLGKTKYNVGASVLLSANIEARYAWLDLGLSYAQGIVDDAAESIDDSSGVLSGSVKIDELFPGHDVKIAALWGRYRGLATAGANVMGPAKIKIKTNYIDTQLLALNKWRIKYGVAYTYYRVPAAVHAWTSPKGSSGYTYEGSHLRDVTFNDVDLILGYSKLDYAAKYENHYNNIIFDADVAAGLTFYNYKAITTTLGDATDDLTFHLRFDAQLGWLYFHRFQSARGLGFYVRPAYTAQLGFTGSSSAPSPRDSDKTEEDAILGKLSLLSVRHGPWLDAGLVW